MMPSGINGGLQSALRATTPARAGKFVELDQADLGGPVPCAKIFSFSFDPNHLHILRHPGPHKGAFRDRHERRVGMRWTRVALLTRAHSCGRRSRVVLTPQWLASSSLEASFLGAKVTNKPDRLGEHEVSRKAVACGNAG